MLKAVKQYFTTTKTNSIWFTHKWTLDNFSLLYTEDHAWKWEICSNKFSPPNNELFEFELYLHPKGDNDEIVKESGVPLIGVCANDMPRMYEGKVRCRWNVWIEDENGIKCIIGGLEEYCLFGNQGGILPDLIQYSKLLDPESQYFFYSKLILYLEIHLQADEPIFNVITDKLAGESRFDCANKVTRVEHSWTVENFAVDEVDADEEMVMHPFFVQSNHFPEHRKHLFCLQLYPNGWSEESQDWVDIVFWNDNENCNVTVHLRLSLLDSDSEKCFTQGMDCGNRLMDNDTLFIHVRIEGTNKIDSKNGRIFRYLRASIKKNSNGLVVDNKLRIHCEMSYMIEGKTQDHSQMSDCVYKSESITDVTQKAIHFVSHKWTIDKFSYLNSNLVKNNFKDSEIFKSSNFRFHLRLWPNGHDEHSKDYISLDLYNVSQDSVIVQYRIFLCATNGYKWRLCCDQSTISKGDKVGISKLLPKSYFHEPAIIKKYLQNDKLNILCQICVLEDRKLDKTNIIIDKPIGQDTEALVNKAPPTHLKKINFHGSYNNYHKFDSKIIGRDDDSKY